MGRIKKKNKHALGVVLGGGVKSVADLLKEEEETEKQWKAIFEKIDDDQSGSLEFSEISEAFKELELELTDVELREQFKTIDMDDSGSIEFTEFARLLRMNFESGDKKSKFRKSILDLAKNEDESKLPEVNSPSPARSGRNTKKNTYVAELTPLDSIRRVNSNKIKEIFDLNGMTVEDRHTREIFDLLDEDQSGTIEIDEFLEVLRLGGSKLSLKQIREQFQIIDSDHNAAIEFDEFAVLLERCFEIGDAKAEIKEILSNVEGLKYKKEQRTSTRSRSPNPPDRRSLRAAQRAGAGVIKPRLFRDSDNFKKWDSFQVGEFIKWTFQSTIKRNIYSESFIEKGVNGKKLASITDKQLSQLGLKKLHRLRVLNEVKYMLHQGRFSRRTHSSV